MIFPFISRNRWIKKKKILTYIQYLSKEILNVSASKKKIPHSTIWSSFNISPLPQRSLIIVINLTFKNARFQEFLEWISGKKNKSNITTLQLIFNIIGQHDVPYTLVILEWFQSASVQVQTIPCRSQNKHLSRLRFSAYLVTPSHKTHPDTPFEQIVTR